MIGRIPTSKETICHYLISYHLEVSRQRLLTDQPLGANLPSISLQLAATLHLVPSLLIQPEYALQQLLFLIFIQIITEVVGTLRPLHPILLEGVPYLPHALHQAINEHLRVVFLLSFDLLFSQLGCSW